MGNRVYVAGPMQGFPQNNIPLFDRWAAILRKEGWDVVSPAELDDPEYRKASLSQKGGETHPPAGATWGDLLARDIKLIADGGITHILLLPGWERSRGARLEAFVGLLNKIGFLEAHDGVGYHTFISPNAVRDIIRRNMP